MAGWWDEAKTSGGMRDLKSLSRTLLFETTDFHYGRLDDHVPAAVREMSGGGNQAQIYTGRVLIQAGAFKPFSRKGCNTANAQNRQ